MHATADAATCPGEKFGHDVTPHLRQLNAVALRLTRDSGHAEDLVQDTLTRAYVKFDQFTPGTNLGAWLYRILLHTFYSSCRQRSRRPAELLTADDQAASRAAMAAPATKSAEAEALGRLGDSPAVRALAGLPEAYKTVIYLADIEDYRYAEIAELLDIPVGTVMSRAHRGRAIMRGKLEARRPVGVPRSRARELARPPHAAATRLAA